MKSDWRKWLFYIAALWYLLLTTIWMLVQNRVEARLARSERAVVSQGPSAFGRMTGLAH